MTHKAYYVANYDEANPDIRLLPGSEPAGTWNELIQEKMVRVSTEIH